MTTITPFLWFDGRVREAVDFYTSLFGDSAVLSTTVYEVDRLWDALCEGGQPSQCGWLVDKFGLSWQIIPTALGQLMGGPDPERAGRVMQAMLGMIKIDIAGLQRATDDTSLARLAHRHLSRTERPRSGVRVVATVAL